MSSDEDVPARHLHRPPWWRVVRASCEPRSEVDAREESGSDEDAEEPEDWEDDGEASSEEDERKVDPYLHLLCTRPVGSRDRRLKT